MRIGSLQFAMLGDGSFARHHHRPALGKFALLTLTREKMVFIILEIKVIQRLALPMLIREKTAS